MVDIVVGSAVHMHYNFKDGFRTGQQLIVGGVSGDSRFGINFYTADGIALHCNPRQGEGEIVMNTKTGDEWGDEERIDCSFGSGDSFEISITCGDTEYFVEVVGGCSHTYSQRMPKEDVLYVQVEGDTSLTKFLLNN